MRNFLVLALVGLAAQMVDGSLGMAYGVTSSTLLLAAGVGPRRGVGRGPLLRDRHVAGLRVLPPQARQRRLAHRLDPGRARRRRGLRRRDPAGQPARRRGQAVGGGDPAGPRPLRHLPLPGAPAAAGRPSAAGRPPRFLAPLGLVAGASTRSAAVAGARSGPPRCCPADGSSPARWSARSTPRSSSSPSGARSASCSPSAARASPGQIAGALLLGGVIAAPLAAWLVRHLPARVLGVAAGGVIVLTNGQTILQTLEVGGTADRRRPVAAGPGLARWLSWWPCVTTGRVRRDVGLALDDALADGLRRRLTPASPVIYWSF